MNDFIEKLEKVNLGMTEESVRGILPMPQRIKRCLWISEKDGESVRESIWLFDIGLASAKVLFRYGKVASVSSEESFSVPGQEDVVGPDKCGCSHG